MSIVHCSELYQRTPGSYLSSELCLVSYLFTFLFIFSSVGYIKWASASSRAHVTIAVADARQTNDDSRLRLAVGQDKTVCGQNGIVAGGGRVHDVKAATTQSRHENR